ncbi:MAG TPA: hypothetical protein PKM36_04200 [Propionibacteriaceae bacterium]|nr:hypothetical protein [Propionibacteriaceae bacterium]HPZ49354.1 hypothetical protein [Propionibacteriaceae bacterium]HQE32955.1 hypothetical protein [Propionibacteriaceae bacterium]
MAAENSGRNLRTVALCLVAWVVMGLVSFVHQAVADSPTQAPTFQICASTDACTR